MSRRIAIVTGVSRLTGIGKAICCELAKSNLDIFFTYWRAYDRQMPWPVDSHEPDRIQEEIRGLGVACEQLEVDLSAPQNIAVLLQTVEQTLGNPSVLVNNATYSTETTLNNFTEQELDKHYQLNLKATTLLTLEFVRRFKAQPHGRVINVTSGQSKSPMSNEIAYAITKGAIETLTYTLSGALAAHRITINAVNPGPTDTGWMSQTQREELLRRLPMGRLGQPTDAARVIAFLASEQAEWITGQVIHSEGGFSR